MVALTAIVISAVGPATAEDAAAQRAPVWSGLDARTYPGPIPAPGTLIRQVPLDRSVTLPAAGRAYRILYATRDIRNRPAVSTAAVFLPKSPPPPGGYPVLAWAHGTVGLGDDCTPSAQPRIARDTRYLGHWLEKGYAIVATDYAGLGTPGLMSYLNGKAEAHAIVDSVIAAHQMGLPLARKWAIIGQSQGAGAALAGARDANRLSAGRALDYRGVVATGTPANIEQVIALAGPLPATLPPSLTAYVSYVWAGFSDARPDLRPLAVLTPEGRRIIALARTTCYQSLKPLVRGKSLRDIFSAPVSSIPGARAALAEYMGTPYSGFDRPIFLGQGLRDVDVPAPSALSLYAQMRAAGQPVELHVYPDQDHSGTVIASMRDSTPFLARIMR